MPTPSAPVHVIGAGPGGLATAAALAQRGVRTVLVEKSGDVGASWRGHYDRLRLHTTRRWSSLPGLSIPRSAGRWVRRDDFVRYLEVYARHHKLDLATGVEVFRIARDPVPDRDGDWLLEATGGRRLRASAVVVATGYNHTPWLPDWPGRASFTGELLHASRYREPSPFAGRDVLVVGVGNTGAEIAADLAEGGAGRVRLAVRTPPHILRRSTLGWPSQASAVLCRRLPVRLVDRLARPVEHTLPDLTRYGLPRARTGIYSRVREGAIPVLDAGLIRAVRRRKVEPVGAVEEFAGADVRLADGTVITPEVVVAATGYRRGLEPLVAHLGLLDGRGLPLVHGRRTHPAAPGLYFTGYTSPLSGMLRELARDAPKIAAAVAAAARSKG
ncbi:flavin-containing monooxygenase [Streptomyces avicenniae]|uniref:flavin-containing monooxygenase n=1 Tax=Streptomyces avicenniae TaxID=500153 RepID=UPI00069B296C|nr:NAD(P)/FAD-dependent oxidoreductase [Streptomyces avicenniae]